MAKKKNATKRILFIIGGLVVLLVILGVVGSVTGLFGGGNDGVEVEVAQAELRDVTQLVTASGRVQPEVEVKISPDVAGEIIALPVKEGDFVERGALLARIRPDFFAAQVEQADAGVLQAKANAAQRQADMLESQFELKRQQELFEKKVVAESQLQAAQAAYEVKKAAYEAAQYAVQSAEASRREAREQLGKTSIYAPMSGTVSKLDVELGERVVGTSQMAGTEMMRIARLNQMEVEVDVNENDVVNVSLGDSARIEVDAYPDRTFRGLVTEIANSARVSGMGTQEQVTNFPVKIRIVDAHNIDLNLAQEAVLAEEVPVETIDSPIFRPGMSGTVDVYTKTIAEAVAVPIQAVTVRDFNRVDTKRRAGAEEADADTTDAAPASGFVAEDLRKVVFIAEDGEARMVEVETGISDDTHIVVKSGLTGKEMVIIGPYRAVSRTLEPGMAVKVEAARPGAVAAAR